MSSQAPSQTEIRSGVDIKLTDLTRSFEGENDTRVEVIAGMNLEVAAGEFLGVLGPSGCGKSTLLRLIAGLLPPTSGTVGLSPSVASTAFVFQDAHLLPWRTVLDNAALPLELKGADREQRYARARTELDHVGLRDALDRYPAQLSGGMRMRVSLARALVTDPQLLLMDEPFAALDEITRFNLEVHLRQLWERRGMTVIFVTHSISEAAFLTDRAIVLSRRGGRVKLDQAMELPRRRDHALRSDPRLGKMMNALMAAMEEE